MDGIVKSGCWHWHLF